MKAYLVWACLTAGVLGVALAISYQESLTMEPVQKAFEQFSAAQNRLREFFAQQVANHPKDSSGPYHMLQKARDPVARFKARIAVLQQPEFSAYVSAVREAGKEYVRQRMALFAQHYKMVHRADTHSMAVAQKNDFGLDFGYLNALSSPEGAEALFTPQWAEAAMAQQQDEAVWTPKQIFQQHIIQDVLQH